MIHTYAQVHSGTAELCVLIEIGVQMIYEQSRVEPISSVKNIRLAIDIFFGSFLYNTFSSVSLLFLLLFSIFASLEFFSVMK